MVTQWHGKKAIAMVYPGGALWLRIDPGRHMAFATHICTANKVFTMEKSLGWGTMLQCSIVVAAFKSGLLVSQ